MAPSGFLCIFDVVINRTAKSLKFTFHSILLKWLKLIQIIDHYLAIFFFTSSIRFVKNGSVYHFWVLWWVIFDSKIRIFPASVARRLLMNLLLYLQAFQSMENQPISDIEVLIISILQRITKPFLGVDYQLIPFL